MSYGTIYKIQFPNGKHYIGLTTSSLHKRKKEHKSSAKNDDNGSIVLYKALRKYNMVDIFELIEVDTADTLEELCEKEIRYIQEYKSYYLNGHGYNMTYGGDGINGYVFTEGDKVKNSIRQLERFKDPKEREKLSVSQNKRFEDPKEREKCSKGQLKRFETPESRQKHSISQKKRHEDNPNERKEHSEKIKENYLNNPDLRLKILDARGKNKPFDIYTVDGTFIKTFTYQLEAREYLQKEYNINSTIKIGEVLVGRRKTTAGFVFKYR